MSTIQLCILFYICAPLFLSLFEYNLPSPPPSKIGFCFTALFFLFEKYQKSLSLSPSLSFYIFFSKIQNYKASENDSVLFFFVSMSAISPAPFPSHHPK